MYTADGHVRPHYTVYADWLTRQPTTPCAASAAEADSLFHRVGITFAVYERGRQRAVDPVRHVPRIVSAGEWRGSRTGCASA